MSPTEKARVSSDEFVSLDHVQNLPYLKHIELTKFAPSHFGLQNWTRLFVIPDRWMRRIYKNEVYKDTDLPGPTTETITREQKQILYEWLFNHSPIKSEPNPIRVETRRTRTCQLQYDDIIELLDNQPDYTSESDDCDTTLNDTNNESKIPKCYGHKIQPEYVIFEKAISKMRHLSAEDEARFKEIINDEELMKVLNDNVKNYLSEACS